MVIHCHTLLQVFTVFISAIDWFSLLILQTRPSAVSGYLWSRWPCQCITSTFDAVLPLHGDVIDPPYVDVKAAFFLPKASPPKVFNMLIHVAGHKILITGSFAPPSSRTPLFPGPLPALCNQVCRRDSTPTQSLPPGIHHPSPQFMCPAVMCAPAHDQRQHAKSRRLSKAEDAEEAEEWIRSKDGITEEMTRLNGVYVRYVSAPADDKE